MSKIIKPERLGRELDEVLQEFDNLTRPKINRGVRAAVIRVWGRIIAETPVDEGRARGNWFVTFGAPSKQTAGKKSKTKGGNYVRTKTRGLDIFMRPKWFLTNNMPYIRKLEFGGYNGPTDKVTSAGFSKQAPKGMVRRNLLRWRKALRDAFRGV